MRSALRLTSGLAVAGVIWLAGTGISAAEAELAPAAAAPVSTTNCPTIGNFGNGTPQSADQAFASISPTATPSSSSSGKLAFTGANLPKEAAAGFVLVAVGGLVVQRSRRRNEIALGPELGDGAIGG